MKAWTPTVMLQRFDCKPCRSDGRFRQIPTIYLEKERKMRMPLFKLPRITLGQWPTPIHELRRLSDMLEGPRIFVKREDLTGLALGGNKCRKLEYVLADAQLRGIDTLISSGSSQSNFALQMAAASRTLGMEPYLVLVKGLHTETQGNLLLHKLLDSNVKIVEVDDPKKMFSEINVQMNELSEELKSQGRHPMVVPAGAFMPVGTAGWVNAAEEISRQFKALNINLHYAVLTNGSGGTQAGLLLGFNQLGESLKVIGVSVLFDKNEAADAVASQIEDTAKLLSLNSTIKPNQIMVYDDYIGSGYGVPTLECIQAIKRVAQTEGFFLDPVYTGKAMAGLIHLIKQGFFHKKDNILFLHTGGVAADFAYQKELSG